MDHAARGLQKPWLADMVTSFLLLHDRLNVLAHVGIAPAAHHYRIKVVIEE
jgi:hypothetical protein